MGRNCGVPRYRQLVTHILSLIRSGRSDRLPSERALVRKFHVARNTARRALDELRRQGMVQRLQGSGSYRQRGGRVLASIMAFSYYITNQHHDRLFNWLDHLLASQGYQLLRAETGLFGENLALRFRRDEVRNARAIFWLVSSHPRGQAEAIRYRRRIPSTIPLVLMNDPLGLSFQSRRPFDLVHFDYAEMARRLVQLLLHNGVTHPILLRRRDDTVFSSQQGLMGFMAQVKQEQIPDPARLIVEWDLADAQSLAPLRHYFRKLRGMHPAIILPWGCYTAFFKSCRKAGLMLPADLPVLPFTGDTDALHLARNFRDMAVVIAELLLSRLQRPHRPNMHVLLPVPVLAVRRP